MKPALITLSLLAVLLVITSKGCKAPPPEPMTDAEVWEGIKRCNRTGLRAEIRKNDAGYIVGVRCGEGVR